MRRLGALILIAAFAAIPTAPTQAASFTPFILGGEPVPSARQAPWGALLVVRREGSTEGSQCSGSIVDAEHVVTAAHCSFDDADQPWPLGGYRLMLGNTNGTTERDRTTEQVVGVTEVRIPPDYDPGRIGNDVAVLTVNPPISFTPEIQPIPVVPENGGLVAGSPARIYGWGKIDNERADGHEHTLAVSILRPWQCSSGTPSILCTRSTVGSPCGGDSGGGLVSTTGPPVLLAVENYGPVVCKAGNRNGYTDLSTPEMHSWLTGALAFPRAPRTVESANLQGDLVSGQTVTCRHPEWSGDPSLRTAFAYSDTERIVQEGRSPQRLLTARDVGRPLICISIATNAGGTTEAASFSILYPNVRGRTADLVLLRSKRRRGERRVLALRADPAIAGRKASITWKGRCSNCPRFGSVRLSRNFRLVSPAFPPGARGALVLRLPRVVLDGAPYVTSALRVRL